MEIKSKQTIQDRLYVPLKFDDKNKLGYMYNSHGKLKSYKSTTSLKLYAPGYDKIAIYKLSKIEGMNENTDN